MKGLISKRLFPLLLLPMLLVGCKSHKPKEGVPSGSEVVVIKKLKKPDDAHKRLAAEARTWLGTPYAYAKSEKGVGTDCSGMVLKVYLDVMGTKLPRNSAQQADFCKSLRRDEVEIGDLVFFATGGNPKRVSHVGIMLDTESFIHASASKGVVISKISAPYYTRRFIKFGRVPSGTKAFN